MRILMLLSAVSIAVVWTWLTTKPEDTYLLLLGLLPVLDVRRCPSLRESRLAMPPFHDRCV